MTGSLTSGRPHGHQLRRETKLLWWTPTSILTNRFTDDGEEILAISTAAREGPREAGLLPIVERLVAGYLFDGASRDGRPGWRAASQRDSPSRIGHANIRADESSRLTAGELR